MTVVFIYTVDVFFLKSSISIYCNLSFLGGVFYIVHVIIFFRGGYAENLISDLKRILVYILLTIHIQVFHQVK